MLSTQAATPHHAAPVHEPPAALRAAGIVIALTAAIAIVAIAFALPASRSKPHDVPVGVAGPQAATSQIAERLEQQAPGAFSVTYYPGENALREAILHRNVYGGIAFGPQGPTLLTATGGSPAVAQLLTQIGNGIAAHSGVPLHTEDLAPPTTQDPRGTGLAASALPITLAGILPAAALVLALRREVWTRLTAAIVFSALAGITVAALVRYVFGSIDSNLWGVAAGLTLGIAAAGLLMLGLGSLFGKVGLAVGAALALLLGNPLSGLTAAPEMLPAGWGQLGQLLPQGATATLLRSTAYFNGAGADTAIIVLSCWVVVGLALVIMAALRRPARTAPKMQLRGTR
ncbi:ABC transporter permease [Mycolicibacterium fortuitum]|uniref:ABC transporter permease n=1 Tax=Mycolicibacterium fortuitum TaxID=1766 RepID=UPI00241D2532|nr:ABC transporter permease [Mycolicibacterium fortuitum]MDG5773110.1 ABC transporter permease [Mycolicibacterium fortuitum]MDG5783506.1 ABC transporter permease [Mycolicibacterium fortuitum]MDG5785660.1 ABC transporter permease [Mycolicibacterium fortuitum]